MQPSTDRKDLKSLVNQSLFVTTAIKPTVAPGMKMARNHSY